MRAIPRVGWVVLALCASLALASSLRAQVYLWTDAQGRVHMTDDLSQVPPSERERARQAAESAAGKAGRERFIDPSSPEAPIEVRAAAAARQAAAEAAAAKAAAQEEAAKREGETPAAPDETGADAGKASKPAKPAKAAKKRGRRHVLRLERSGSEIRVVAELNGRVAVPFILDTGAQMCTLPAAALDELEIEIDENTPTVSVVGVSGRPMQVPEIQIGSVALGEAVVENVQMSVLTTMDVGLLGMPFFNHFKVEMDPVAGTLTLEEIAPEKLEESAVSGMNEKAWRKKFAQRIAQIEAARRALDEIPSVYVTDRERLEARIAVLEEQLEELESQADRAGVPQSWRE